VAVVRPTILSFQDHIFLTKVESRVFSTSRHGHRHPLSGSPTLPSAWASTFFCVRSAPRNATSQYGNRHTSSSGYTSQSEHSSPNHTKLAGSPDLPMMKNVILQSNTFHTLLSRKQQAVTKSYFSPYKNLVTNQTNAATPKSICLFRLIRKTCLPLSS
jgi:hypothetical protein